MSGNLPAITIPIIGDISGFVAALARVQQATAQFGAKLSGSFGGTQQNISRLVDGFKGLVGPLVAAAGAYATFSAAMEALHRADALGKTAAALDITTESLQELQAVASVTGGSAEGMSMALRELMRNLSQAQAGDEAAIKSFAKLGLTIESLKGMKADELFLEVTDAMAGMANAQDRLQVSQELLGRGSRDLMETLTLGKAAFKDAAAEARAYGRILSEADVKTLKDMNDKVDGMKLTFEVLVSKIMTQFEGSISFISDEIGRGAGNASAMQVVFWGIDKVLSVIVALVADIAKAFIMTGTAVAGVSAMIVQGFWQAVQKAYQFVTWIGKVIWEVMKNAGAAFDYLWQLSKIAFLKIKEFGAEIFGKLLFNVGEAVRTVGLKMQELGIIGGESLTEMGEGLSDFGRVLKSDIKKDMEEAAAEMAKDADKMNGTLSNIGKVKGEQPQFLRDMEAGAGRLAEQYGRFFIGMESSIFNLGAKWASVDAPVNMVHSSQMKVTKSISDAADAVVKLKKDYEAFQKDVEAYAKKGAEAGVQDSPLARMEAEHAEMLASLERFKASAIGKTVAYNEERAKIEASFAAQRARLLDDQHTEIQAKIDGYGKTDYEVKLKEFEDMAKLEDDNYKARVEAADVEIEDEIARNSYKEQLAQQHADNVIAIEQQKTQTETQLNQARAATIAGILGQAAALMDKNNKQQFMAWKVFASGQAIINALLSFSTIMGDPKNELMFGPAGQIALASTSLALGMAAAAKIASTPYGGGGTGTAGLTGGGGGAAGRGGGNTGAEAARSMNPAMTNVNVSLHGDTFSGDQVRGLISLINQQQAQNMVIKAN